MSLLVEHLVTKILIVEDNEMNRDMLSRRLQRRGYEIVTAENGEIALEKVKSDHPDIILMDMRMPVMDGWTATKKIKEDSEISDIPIVGLSANAMEGDRERALKAGCDEYETKPVNFENLLNLINKYQDRAA